MVFIKTVLNKSENSPPSPRKKQLYSHLTPIITHMVQIRCTRHAGHWWRSTDELGTLDAVLPRVMADLWRSQKLFTIITKMRPLVQVNQIIVTSTHVN